MSELAEKLFGKASVLHARGGHTADPAMIAGRNFENPGSAAFLFCSGCGSIFETDSTGKAALEKFSGTLPDSPPAYFQTKGCIACDRDVGTITIEKIPTH